MTRGTTTTAALAVALATTGAAACGYALYAYPETTNKLVARARELAEHSSAVLRDAWEAASSRAGSLPAATPAALSAASSDAGVSDLLADAASRPRFERLASFPLAHLDDVDDD